MDFDEAVFPYVYECPRCGAEETVTWREAVDLASHCATPAEAAEFVIAHLKGWNVTLKQGAVCPDCLDVVSSSGSPSQ